MTTDIDMITPTDQQSSITYLRENGCNVMEIYLYTYVLNDPTALKGFLGMPDFKSKIEYLIGLVKYGIVEVPFLDRLDRQLLPPELFHY